MNWAINDCHSDAGTFFKVGAIGKRVNWEKTRVTSFCRDVLNFGNGEKKKKKKLVRRKTIAIEFCRDILYFGNRTRVNSEKDNC